MRSFSFFEKGEARTRDQAPAKPRITPLYASLSSGTRGPLQICKSFNLTKGDKSQYFIGRGYIRLLPIPDKPSRPQNCPGGCSGTGRGLGPDGREEQNNLLSRICYKRKPSTSHKPSSSWINTSLRTVVAAEGQLLPAVLRHTKTLMVCGCQTL